MPDVDVHGLDVGPVRDRRPAAPRRLLERDHTLWRDDPTEISDRLGWLEVDRHATDLAELDRLAQQCVDDGLTDAVVVGMGGSSLFPDVLARTFAPRRLRLHVLDSTHPRAVRRALELAADTTVFVVASKSGTTIEPRSHLEALWADRTSRLGVAHAGTRFAAITDPGSELDRLATERSFRFVLRNPSDVGGRFSALTLFGLAPAALAGVDTGQLLASARRELDTVGHQGWSSPAGLLALAVAAGVEDGRDKLVVHLPAGLTELGAWIEQLVAESLGKDGTTVAPVVGDTPDVLSAAHDRLVVDATGRKPDVGVAMGEVGAVDLGALVVRWEVATALAGALLGVQPFDQPDVAAAKTATSAVLASGPGEVAPTPLGEALAHVVPGDHLVITAFVDPGGALPQRLEGVRRALRDRLGVTTTLGIGPRYLHSTGQLHKGGGAAQVVLQVVEEPDVDLAIPGQAYGFATLLRAQAQGDLEALRSNGRRADRIALEELLASA